MSTPTPSVVEDAVREAAADILQYLEALPKARMNSELAIRILAVRNIVEDAITKVRLFYAAGLNQVAENCVALERGNQELREQFEAEQGRWQWAIRELVIKESGAPPGDIDGTGCESGDILDGVLAEIGQGFAYLKNKEAFE